MIIIGLETQNRVEETDFIHTLIHGHFNKQPAIGLNHSMAGCWDCK